jgi:hypothetical protein
MNEFTNNINIIFILGPKVTEVMFFTKDDKCYGFGKSEIGELDLEKVELGLGHNRQVREPKFIEELCYNH